MFPYNTDIPLILFVLFLAYLLSDDEADPEGGITPHSLVRHQSHKVSQSFSRTLRVYKLNCKRG